MIKQLQTFLKKKQTQKRSLNTKKYCFLLKQQQTKVKLLPMYWNP